MNDLRRLQGVRVLAALRGLELFGHERGNIEVFKALRSQGAEVCVAVTSMNNGGAVRTELERLAFPTVSIPFGFQWSKQYFKSEPHLIFLNTWFWVRANMAFDRAIRQFRPTHVHMGCALAFNFVELGIRRHGLPLVARLGDGPPEASAVQMMIWRRFVRAAARVVAISKYIWDISAKHELALGHKSHSIIHNLAPSPADAPQQPNYASNTRNVVYIGQITKEKGVFQFLEAAAQLVPKFEDVRFHFIGGSSNTETIEAELRLRAEQMGLGGRVVFHGWVGNANAFLAAADVHVAPSLWQEPLGNVVMEAKRAGTPSVVFPSGGLPEMIRHGVDGVVCREPSGTALAEGISWALERMRQAPPLRAEVRADFQARYGLERFARAWAEVYEPRGILSDKR